MAGVTLTVDSTTVDAANVAFVINDNSTRFLLAEDYPMPEPQVIWAQPIDADGDLPAHMRYGNRQGCTVRFVIQGSSAANLEQQLGQWSQKLTKVNRDGGTLLRATPAGTSYYLTVLPGTHGANFDRRYTKVNRCEVTWTFPAGPFWRATAETDLGDNVETTLPALVFTDTVPGDADALGRLVVDEDQAVDQWWLTYGVETNALYDISQSSAWLFAQAESLTALGGSATAVGPSGASGAGSNVMRNTALSTSYQAVLSTQATGGGAHLTHVGTFRVYARVQVPTSNSGTVSVALEWSHGDFQRSTQNNTQALDETWKGTWRLVDLGLVGIPKLRKGTQRWEGRILAKSTVAGDDIDVDYLLLIPVSVASGTAQGVLRLSTPTVFSARDEFDQTTGALTGKTLPSTGTWSGAGDADDFSVVSGAIAQRTAVSDAANTGRWERASTGTLTNVVVQTDFRATTAATISSMTQGVFARYTDTNNLVQATVSLGGTLAVEVRKRVAGVPTIITPTSQTGGTIQAAANVWYTIRLMVDAAGRFTVWLGQTGNPLLIFARGQDADLATGGTLASGGYGIYDQNATANAWTRDYDNFFAFAPVPDAAMFASQSLEVRYDGIVREDSGGTIWPDVSDFQGDPLRIPAAGRENRTARVIVKACRNDPATGPDSAIDDISARLFVTPQYVTVPI